MGEAWGYVREDCRFAVDMRRGNEAFRGVVDERAASRARGPAPASYPVGEGRSMTVPEMIAATGLSRSTIYGRVALGMRGPALLQLKPDPGLVEAGLAPAGEPRRTGRMAFHPEKPDSLEDWVEAAPVLGTPMAGFDPKAGTVTTEDGLVFEVRIVRYEAKTASRPQAIRARRAGKPRWLLCHRWANVEALVAALG